MSIFKGIEGLSKRLAKKWHEKKGIYSIERYEYASFLLLSHIFTFGTGLLLSIIFSYSLPYIISMFTFCFLRAGAGGHHCRTFDQCFITTNCMFIVSCMIALLTVNFTPIMWLISNFGAIFIFPICPKPSINSPSRGYSEDIRFRKIYRNWLLILQSISLLSIFFGLNLISSSISAGILVVVFIVSNTGEHIINKFWESK